MAVLTALVGICTEVAGFTNQLVELVGDLLNIPYGSRQAAYDLRRLIRKGLIAYLPGSPRFRRARSRTGCDLGGSGPARVAVAAATTRN